MSSDRSFLKALPKGLEDGESSSLSEMGARGTRAEELREGEGHSQAS